MFFKCAASDLDVSSAGDGGGGGGGRDSAALMQLGAEDEECAVSVVDFQFTGGGVPMQDVMYLLYPDARGDFFEEEEALLEVYHETLVTELAMLMRGGPSTYPLELARAHYDLCRVDFFRHLLGRGFVASTASEVRLIQEVERTMTALDGGACLSEEEYAAACAALATPG